MLPLLVRTLVNIAEEASDHGAEAQALLALIDRRFIFCLVIIQKVLDTTQMLSKVLEAEGLVLCNGLRADDATLTEVKAWADKPSTYVPGIILEATRLCREADVSLSEEGTFLAGARFRRVAGPTVQTFATFGTDLFAAIATSVRDEFMARFKGAEVSVVLNGIAAFDPKSFAFLTEDALLAMAKYYHYKGAKVTRLQAEVTNFRFNFEDPDNQASELSTSCVIQYSISLTIKDAIPPRLRSAF